MSTEADTPDDADAPDEEAAGSRPDAEHDTVARLLGREPAGAFAVVVRQPDGSPVVIENAPLLRDGRPMPTRFWLIDPQLREEVSRLEAAGGVRRAAAAVPMQALEEAHSRYAAERARAIPPDHTGPVPSGGVGGTRRGVKCLHAHLAWYLAGGDDPVGRWTAAQLGVRREDVVVEGGTVRTPRGPVAAVDCGTNSTRLIVVATDGTVLEREMRITRLGEGVDATRTLAPAAMERTLAVLREYRRMMDRHGVLACRTVATSAARDAGNAEEFLSGVIDIVGVRPEILSGDEEGRLAFAGATARLPAGTPGTARVLVVDIGGGSTELVTGELRGPGAAASGVTSLSLDFGCVRVSERFLHHNPPLRSELDAARGSIERALTDAAARLRALPQDGLLIGLAGTVSTLSCLNQEMSSYDRARIHHSVLTRQDVERWLTVLSAEDATARLRRPGMAAGREDVIVGGALVLAVVMEVFHCQRCLVSEDDILDGIAADLLAAQAPA